MATFDYVITITDGTLTETLTASPWGIIGYIPNPPDPEAVDSLTDADTITEQMNLRVMDGSVSNNLDEIRGLQALFDQARKAQTDPSLARVYITFLQTTGGAQYRSEIVNGKIEWDDQTLSPTHWKRDVQLATLFFTRRYYWEATTAVAVPVSNGQGTDNTSGLSIFNPNPRRSAANAIAFVQATSKITDTGNGLAIFKTDDTIVVSGTLSNDGIYTVHLGNVAGEIVVHEALVNEAAGAGVVTIIGPKTNYVEIKAADVATVINAPVRLELTNATGANMTMLDLHIGTSRINSIANMVFMLEAEDGTGGAETESATCSGALYNAISWADDNIEVEIWTYTLTAAMLAASRGAYWLAIARLADDTVTAATKLRLNVKLSTTTIYEGPLITCEADKYMQVLGIIQLPPYLERITAPVALTLSLRGLQDGGGAIKLDFIHLIPVDSYRHLSQVGYAIPNGDQIYIDEIYQQGGIVRGITGASTEYNIWVKRGIPLKLQNNTLQRIYFAWNETGEIWNIDSKLTVKVYYRPRRLTL